MFIISQFSIEFHSKNQYLLYDFVIIDSFIICFLLERTIFFLLLDGKKEIKTIENQIS